jgi:hypothetical protein
MWTTLAFLCLANQPGQLAFERAQISDTRYEAASVFDVNLDGALDIVSGEYWFAGPDFSMRQKICDVKPEGDYFDDFADFPMDVNGDGFLDIVSGAWFGQKLTWRENPKGIPFEWPVHDIAEVGNVERPAFWDIDGDGHVDIAPNTPGRPQRIFRLERDASGTPLGTFQQHTISERVTGHGLGFGDINGDGRGDLIVWNGWFEAPSKPFTQEWTWHEGPALFDSASVPILVHDVNADGRNDIIVGAGHNWGLAWWEQGKDLTWTRHDIETDRSQFHEMALADLDNDGALELVTGKRWRAHPEGDPGVDDPVGLYYYKINGGRFERHVLDYGPGEDFAGTGIYLWVEDIDGNGWKDIVAPGKGGLYLFSNRGQVDTD